MRERKRTWTDKQFIEVVKTSLSASEVLRRIGLREAGGNYGTVRKAAKRLGIDISHWLGCGHLRGKNHSWGKNIPLKEVMKIGSSYSRRSLKRRLLSEGILENKCSLCGQRPEWRGKILLMILDHINGVNNDNRLDNLRMLCPNCNSQQDTFTGRNNKGKVSRTPREKLLCRGCGKELREKRKTGMCISCVNKKNTTVAQLAGGISFKN